MPNSPKNHNSESIESKVMDEIESGRVKLRSPYLFLAEKLGIGSAIVLTIILGVLFFAMFLFYVRATGNMVYLSFGKEGVYAFLESFPYALVIAVVLLVLVGGILFRKSHIAYKKPFRYFALGMVLFMVAAGAALTYTHVAEMLEEQAFRHTPPLFFKALFGGHDNDRGVAGKVIAQGPDYVEIQAPCGILRLDTSRIDPATKSECGEGRYIVAVGKRGDDGFMAFRISVVDKEDISLINRQVHRRFAPLPGPPSTAISSTPQCH